MFHIYALKQLRRQIDKRRGNVLRLLQAAISYLVRSRRMWVGRGSIVLTHGYYEGHFRWTARVFLPGRTGAYVGGLHIYQEGLGLRRHANATFQEAERDTADSTWRGKTFESRCSHIAYLMTEPRGRIY